MQITYVDYEGMPARLLHEASGVVAELYVSGQGFVRTGSMEVMFHGYAITPKEFEQMVLNLRNKR